MAKKQEYAVRFRLAISGWLADRIESHAFPDESAAATVRRMLRWVRGLDELPEVEVQTWQWQEHSVSPFLDEDTSDWVNQMAGKLGISGKGERTIVMNHLLTIAAAKMPKVEALANEQEVGNWLRREFPMREALPLGEVMPRLEEVMSLKRAREALLLLEDQGALTLNQYADAPTVAIGRWQFSHIWLTEGKPISFMTLRDMLAEPHLFRSEWEAMLGGQVREILFNKRVVGSLSAVPKRLPKNRAVLVPSAAAWKIWQELRQVFWQMGVKEGSFDYSLPDVEGVLLTVPQMGQVWLSASRPR